MNPHSDTYSNKSNNNPYHTSHSINNASNNYSKSANSNLHLSNNSIPPYQNQSLIRAPIINSDKFNNNIPPNQLQNQNFHRVHYEDEKW